MLHLIYFFLLLITIVSASSCACSTSVCTCCVPVIDKRTACAQFAPSFAKREIEIIIILDNIETVHGSISTVDTKLCYSMFFTTVCAYVDNLGIRLTSATGCPRISVMMGGYSIVNMSFQCFRLGYFQEL